MTRQLEPIINDRDDHAAWDEEQDVIVIGFGCAGAGAAIEAADRGAVVLVLERFSGGGATRKSGGVIYAGGGTDPQKTAGFRDSPDRMRQYLDMETGGSVDRATLRAFCERSIENIRWLESMGITFPRRFYPDKTTQPPGGYGLYFSGNERQYGDDPVPRGHVPMGKGMTGSLLFEALKKAAACRGVEIRYRSRPLRIITDTKGAVTGVEMTTLSGSFPVRALHRVLFGLGYVSGTCRTLAAYLEKIAGTARRIRARGGVVIAAGGFVYNRGMMRKYALPYARCMPLGTPGDDGSGIMLGQTAGGAVGSMDSCAASRFICPPEAFTSGALVNMEGRRFCDESLYGATLSRHISEQPGARAYLIIDRGLMDISKKQMKKEERLRDHSLQEILSGEMNFLIFRKYTAFANMRFNRKKADTIAKLEKKCGFPAGSLADTVERYNRFAAKGRDTDFNKDTRLLSPLEKGPFYAIDCRLESRVFPGPCITLGGLLIDGRSGRVKNHEGLPIPGLYAAGRSAAGICSRSYVSGLSLADSIFSGRNAGADAARNRKKPPVIMKDSSRKRRKRVEK